MKIFDHDIKLLKKYGFQWYKNNSTDRVEPKYIRDIFPAANGFTVAYNPKSDSVFKYTTATINKIDYPDDLNNQWIQVHWETIVDERF